MTRARSIPAFAATAVAALTFATAARAAETVAPPSHLTAYNLDWLNYIDPNDLPPSRYAVCIVDSGVAITPDTPPDDPNGPILRRLSVDGGPGEPQGTSEEQMHGTRMAMAAVAPENGWGTIGAWTGGRVISVRAMVEGERTFRPEAYRRGIDKCLEQRPNYPLAAITLSLSCSNCSFSGEERAALADRIARAHTRGVSVLVAAGNAGGTRLDFPASAAGVLPIAAGSSARQLCDYASYDSRAVLAPGCPIETADPLTGSPYSSVGGGSSSATVVTSTLVAALRTLTPDASFEQAESWLRAGAMTADGRTGLDGEIAASHAGHAPVVTRARARMPNSADRPSGPTGIDGPAVPEQLGGSAQKNPAAAHRLRAPVKPTVRWRRGKLMVKLTRRPRGAALEVTAQYLKSDFVLRKSVRRTRRANRLVISLSRKPSRVELRHLPVGGTLGRSSQPVRVWLQRSGR